MGTPQNPENHFPESHYPENHSPERSFPENILEIFVERNAFRCFMYKTNECHPCA